MLLENNLRAARAHKEILLMTHIVLGYPSFEVNRQVIEQMVTSGVDLIEMQIPFSEPVADGPVILRANQEALAAGAKVRDCLAFAAEIVSRYPIPFLLMTYYNVPYKYGDLKFIDKANEIGIQGLIIPDLPLEERRDFLSHAKTKGVAPILIFAPTSSSERLATLAGQAAGFIYCVARKGVTGKETSFSGEIDTYLARARAATSLPLAVGFGIKQKEDVAYLVGKSDIAVIGSETIRLVDREGAAAVGPFIRSLR